MPLEVIPVTTDEQRQRAYALRHDVFITEQKFDAELEIDAYDPLPNTHHFLGRDSETGQFVATARCVVLADERRGKIGRVVVLGECRGKKYGAAIMAAVETAMQDQCDSFVLSSQSDKHTFYEKCGYHRMDNEVELEQGVEHYMMIKSAQP